MVSKGSNAYDRARIRFYRRRVKKTVNSGVRPIVLRYSQINGTDTNLPIAYRTQTYIRSNTLGVLTPLEYTQSCDGVESGLRLAEWNVVEAMRQITALVKKGRQVEWVSVRCPSELAVKVEMYTWMRRLIAREHFKYPEKLCIEFPVSLLSERTELARLSVLDMKLLGVKTMLVDCAADNCPMSRLVQIPVDFVLITPEVTALAGSRNKPEVFPTLVSYLRSMRTAVYADGVQKDSQITTLLRSDCAGYAVSADYKGKKALPFGRNMSFKTAAAQKDTEDDFVL